MNKGKYLEFMSAEIKKGRKTKVFHIFNHVTGTFLGKVKWECGWRQYISVFELDAWEKLRFSAGCHREVSDFIDELMEEWRVEKKHSQNLNNTKNNG